jgi:23S rRNA (guanosine2251-2'-O)-methyltransferase
MPQPTHFVIRQCSRSCCEFRFPSESDNRRARFCPKCGAETIVAVEIPPQPDFPSVQPAQQVPILEALLDNVRSTFNVGAIFRTADGAGFRHLYLCGITPTPENPKVKKTALGAEGTLAWTYSGNSLAAARKLIAEGKQLWALEVTSGSESLFAALQIRLTTPVVLVAGNERAGVDPDLLALCSRTLWIPMHGQKESLNVAVAFSIAAYTMRYA